LEKKFGDSHPEMAEVLKVSPFILLYLYV